MLGTQFYNQAVRKTVISFGTLFNNIELKKTVDGLITSHSFLFTGSTHLPLI